MKKCNPIVLLDEHLYGNCQQYCKMAAVAALGGDYRFVMANDLFYFANDPALPFSVRPTIKQVLTDDQLFETIGIRQECLDGPDVVEAVIAAIQQEKYVMVCVDCFYYPPYAKCYRKKHRYHYFLVYGYDREKSCFYTIEPWGFTMNTPLLREIRFEELRENVARAEVSFDLDQYVRAFSRQDEGESVSLSRFYKDIYRKYGQWLRDNYRQTAEEIETLFYKAALKSAPGEMLQYHGFLDRFVRHKQSQAYACGKLLADETVNGMFDGLIRVYQNCVEETDRLPAELPGDRLPPHREPYARKISRLLGENLQLEVKILAAVSERVQ